MRKMLHETEPRILDNVPRGESYGYDDTDDDNFDDSNTGRAGVVGNTDTR